jgi:hypothetical protein
MEMKAFNVKIVETLEMVVAVSAHSESGALNVILTDYNSEKYVLDYRNHVLTDFEIVKTLRV